MRSVSSGWETVIISAKKTQNLTVRSVIFYGFSPLFFWRGWYPPLEPKTFYIWWKTRVLGKSPWGAYTQSWGWRIFLWPSCRTWASSVSCACVGWCTLTFRGWETLRLFLAFPQPGYLQLLKKKKKRNTVIIVVKLSSFQIHAQTPKVLRTEYIFPIRNNGKPNNWYF